MRCYKVDRSLLFPVESITEHFQEGMGVGERGLLRNSAESSSEEHAEFREGGSLQFEA